MVGKPPADIVNLRRARKAKARADAQKGAEANRLQHGRTGADRALTEARNAKAARDLDAKKRDQGESGSES